MYIEGIQINKKMYILSDEEGELTLLNSNLTPEETDQYIELENKFEEINDEINTMQKEINNINNKNRLSKRINRIIIMSVILTEGLFILLGALSQEPLKIFETIIMTPLSITIVGNIYKIASCGTKKGRNKCKLKMENKISIEKENLKEIEKQKKKYQKNIEKKYCTLEEEIVSVTEVENKKPHVKMRVLRLDQDRQ